MKSFRPDDLFKHRTIEGLCASPHHPRIAFKVGRGKKRTDGYERTAWGMEAGEHGVRQLTSAEFSLVSPRWNRSGRTLAFISKRGDAGAQIHLLHHDGGEAVRLTRAKETLSTIEGWSPDDRKLLVTASCQWDEDGDPDTPNGERRAKVATFLPYKTDGSGIIVGERTHLYAVDVESGALTALTKGDFEVSTGQWSEDGKRLAFVRDRTERERHRSDLWLANADGSDARVRVDTLASISKIAWSPDGRWIAFAGGEEAGDSMVNLFLLAADGRGEAIKLGGEDFELEPASTISWHPDGKRLCVVSSHRGLQKIAIVSVPDGTVRYIDRGLKTVLECITWGDRIAFVSASMRTLEEVHSVGWDGEHERRHTNFNRWFKKRERPRVAFRKFEVPDGSGGTETIRAWVLRPAKGSGGARPTFVDMHGGPHSNVLVDFSAHTYWYALLAQGWNIVAPDAVGSASYGKAFARRLRGKWGELDLPQYQAVVKALQEEGVADERLACGGKSYGGFLSAWAIGHTDMFKAAIVSAPVANIVSHFGTSDTGHYVTPYAMGVEFRDDPALWHAQSPIAYLHRSTTPTLILQGENDGRCPRGQSEEVFAHLIRETQVPVELVIYPTSTHSEAESGRPSNRVDYHDRIAKWAVRWVSKEADQTKPKSVASNDDAESGGTHRRRA